MIERKFATIDDWCSLSGMSRSAAYLALSRRDLKARKLGGRTLIDVDAGLTWLQSLPSAEFRTPKQRGAA